MNDAIETIQYKDHQIEIFPDECGESPRGWENITEIHYHSRSYVLGDTNWYGKIDEYDKMIAKAKRQGDLVIPMFAYIHSGVSLSLSSFYGRLPQGHAEFDSGRAGTVIVRRKKMLEEFGGKIFTQKLKERAYKIAEGDINTYNQYFMGDVYGYVVDEDGDSCYGYYGMEYAIEEAKSVVDYIVDQERKEYCEKVEKERKKHCEKVKQWIKNKVALVYRQSECLA